MSQFVTLSKTDKQFWPMLTGRFSKTHFAQPVRNLYVNSAKETITFKIIEKSSLSLWQALSHWYSLARNIYLVFPIVGGLSYLTAMNGLPSMGLVLSSFLSLQFFLMALTLYNDYSDYINGVDRVNDYSFRKPLVQGLMRPFQARQLALCFLGLSGLLASYCFVQKPQVLLFAFVALGIGFLMISTQVSRYFKGLGLFTTFLLAGPLLVVGYEFLLFDKITPASVILGFVFGIHALQYDFCKQLRDIFYSSKAQVRTISTFFGFEKSKVLYSILSIVHVVGLILFAIRVNKSELYLLVVVAFCFESYLNQLIYSAPSFMSSNLGSCLSLQKLQYTIESSLIVFIFLSPLWLSLF